MVFSSLSTCVFVVIKCSRFPLKEGFGQGRWQPQGMPARMLFQKLWSHKGEAGAGQSCKLLFSFYAKK